MDEDRRTVHISGAGPAGLAAAITAARAGNRVVVHERREGVGGRFHDDFQGIENWSTEEDALETLLDFGVEPDFRYAPFRELTAFDATGRAYRCKSDTPLFYLVRRGGGEGTLDRALLHQAEAAGAEIRFKEAVHHMEGGGIVAEGPHAADVVAAGYTFVTDMADGAFAALSDELAPKGYAYLLVSGGRGTVAACMFEDFHGERRHLDRTLRFFGSHAGLRMREARYFGGIGNVEYPRRAVRGEMLHAGEAAGFQDALWGFGMRYAMTSGHLAARALQDGGPAEYERLWRREIGGRMRAACVNRLLYSHLGDRGYAALLRRVERSKDPRRWLRRLHAPSWHTRLLFPATRRWLRSRRPPQPDSQADCDCTWCRCSRHPAASRGGRR